MNSYIFVNGIEIYTLKANVDDIHKYLIKKHDIK